MLLIDGRMATLEEMQRYFHNNLLRLDKQMFQTILYYLRAVTTTDKFRCRMQYLSQRIEGVRTFAGQTITVSFYAKADAVKNINIELRQDFGTGEAQVLLAATTPQKLL